MKSILITGVSTGIGYGAAKEFANCGYRVFGSVRHSKDAERLGAELGRNFIPLIFDITDADAIETAVRQVTEIVGERGLIGLINNAGIATSGPLEYQSIAEIRQQFEVNTIAPLAITQACLPLLKQAAKSSRSVRIVNISSVAGKISLPFLGAYAGSKHALEGISHSLRRELRSSGIDVIIIAPGAVNTAIWDKESAQEMSAYEPTAYASAMRAFQAYMLTIGRAGYSPEKLGKFIREKFEHPHPQARYAIVPNPLPNWYLPSLLPHRWLDRLIGKNLGL